MKLKLRPAIQVVIALVTLVMCVTIHEAGHAFAGVMTGGVVAQIVILDTQPHVRVLSKGDDATQSLRTAAGSGLVLLIWFACGLISWGSMKWFSFKILSLFAGVELTGWLLSCLRWDGSSQANDAADFLASSRMNPAAVIPLILLLGGTGGLILFLGRHKNPASFETDAQQTALLTRPHGPSTEISIHSLPVAESQQP